MSRWLKVTIVMAAAAFVVAFRFSADGNDADATSAPVSAERASAAVEGAKPVASAVRLAQVVALPSLAKEPAARTAARAKKEAAERKARAAAKKKEAARKKRIAERRKKAAAKRKREAAAAKRRAATAGPSTPRVSATPAPTVQPPVATPVYRAPAPQAPQKKTYVGKDFDSEG
ncbi:hypothetical protein OJ998_37065 [Solirubrobacter taibaiensis]|nr:hypothetical protein [Solirubrobacter taibaiensis]